MKIRSSDLEIIKISTKELLLTFFDLTTPFFEASSLYRKSIRKYLEHRDVDRDNFFDRVQYLRRKGLINNFTKNKEKYLELTPKGVKKARNLLLNELEIKRSKIWDKKWRVVIFDVPEKMHRNRDLLRENLISLKFIQIQKSVYVYPFECTMEISCLADLFFVSKYVTIMISEIIQGEELILKTFLDAEVLNKSDIK